MVPLHDNMICELHTAQVNSRDINFNKAEVASIDFVEIDSLLELANQNLGLAFEI